MYTVLLQNKFMIPTQGKSCIRMGKQYTSPDVFLIHPKKYIMT